MDTTTTKQTSELAGSHYTRATLTSEELYAAVRERGLTHDSHESDLYLKGTPEARALLDCYKFRSNVTSFCSQIDGSLWYDVPFAYTPFWERRTRLPATPASVPQG